VHATVSCINGGEAAETSSGHHRRAAIMRRLEEVLEANPDRTLYLAELCAAVGASDRTLRACCQEFLGMSKIEASDPAIRLIDAGGWFEGEIRESWTDFAASRYLPPGATGSGSREERDRLLGEAEVIIGGWPFPLDMRARAPRLKWFHQRQAGASNLLGSDLWGSDVVVTTSRGVANSLPIAEYAVAGMLHFAMGFHRAAIDRDAGAFDHRAYRPLLVQGKTACVVGAGGIGTEVGRLCAALGMRVVGTRRQPQPGAPLPQGFSEIGGPEALDRFLPQSDFVAICCQWTPETTRLFDKDRFAAMKAGSVLVNVARGEIVDEEALLDALERSSGWCGARRLCRRI